MTLAARRLAAHVLAAALALGLGLGLSACSTLQPAPPAPAAFAGRLSVKVESDPPHAVAAAFELRGTPQAGQLDLATPLGSLMARARWSPAEVVLATPNEEKAYPDLDALTRAVLGESLPVPALFDWLRGRPWDGAPSERLADGFAQLGWTVSLAQFAQGAIEARRTQAPPVTVRARLER